MQLKDNGLRFSPITVALHWVVAFSLLVLILLFRPTGLLGKPEVEKV